MKLAEYFSSDRKTFLKLTPPTGERSEWLDFCELVLKGGSILIVDAQFVPSEEDGLLVKLTPENYYVQAKVVNYGGDLRIARLRVFQSGMAPTLAERFGETWTDTAKTGICDYDTFSQVWGSDDDASYAIIEPFFDTDDDFGIAIMDAERGAMMPFVSSGFGDGSFPVFELLDAGKRVGFEIEFVAEDETCSETPYQKECRLNEIEQRANQGTVELQVQLGKMYQAGKEVEKNLETAVKWFEKAVKNGSAEAALALGVMYKNGNGVTKDLVRARELYEKAAAAGSVSALNELGILYRHGQGVPVDFSKALKLYTEAASKGLSAGQSNLGLCYANGIGVEKNLEEAVKWYRLAADQGQVSAICNLGHCYNNGLGVSKNHDEAVKLYKLGAAKGHALCLHNLGYCYEVGNGVEKNLKNAVSWYTSAALNGLAASQVNLGILFKQGGDGVEKKIDRALRWFHEAAKNENAEAYYELGLLYEAGEGVVADKVEACKLYQKAVVGGFAKADERLKELLPKLTEAERSAVVENSKS